jgi:hypothetical protein
MNEPQKTNMLKRSQRLRMETSAQKNRAGWGIRRQRLKNPGSSDSGRNRHHRLAPHGHPEHADRRGWAAGDELWRNP